MATKKNELATTLSALQQAEAQVQQLKKRLVNERSQRLQQLHQSLGFASRNELIEALVALQGGGGGGGRGRGASVAASPGAGAPGAAPALRASKRARLTPDMKAQILKAIRDGEPGTSVAKRFGISVQTTQNLKKAAGLVQARKKKAKAK
jgi:hypothetical protein